jgi:hypothetical protein
VIQANEEKRYKLEVGSVGVKTQRGKTKETIKGK